MSHAQRDGRENTTRGRQLQLPPGTMRERDAVWKVGTRQRLGLETKGMKSISDEREEKKLKSLESTGRKAKGVEVEST